MVRLEILIDLLFGSSLIGYASV